MGADTTGNDRVRATSLKANRQDMVEWRPDAVKCYPLKTEQVFCFPISYLGRASSLKMSLRAQRSNLSA